MMKKTVLIIEDDIELRIPLERNSLHASAGRLSAPNGKFFKLHWITHVLAI